MDKAINKAIYYTDILTGNVISEYQYSDRGKFSEIIKNFRNDINIRSIFGSVDNLFYHICDAILKCYDDLLLDNIDCLLIITRKDNTIRLSRTNCSKTVGVIKIDSVLAELNLNQTESNKIPYFLFAIVTGVLIYNGVIEKVISF